MTAEKILTDLEARRRALKMPYGALALRSNLTPRTVRNALLGRFGNKGANPSTVASIARAPCAGLGPVGGSPRPGAGDGRGKGARARTNGAVEAGTREDRHDRAEGPAVVGMPVGMFPSRRLLLRSRPGDADVDVTGGQRAALHLPHLEAEFQIESGQIAFELLSLETQVEQCAQKHVSGDSRETIQVQGSDARSLHTPGRAHPTRATPGTRGG